MASATGVRAATGMTRPEPTPARMCRWSGRDSLTMARADTGELERIREVDKPGPSVEECAEMLGLTADARGVRVPLNNLDATLEADTVQRARVVTSLLRDTILDNCQGWACARILTTVIFLSFPSRCLKVRKTRIRV